MAVIEVKHPQGRCPVCGRFLNLLSGGTFPQHTRLKDPKSPHCPMTHRRPPSSGAAKQLVEALRAAFWEYYSLASADWGPDRDDESAAQAALAALRTVDILAVDGQVYLVTASHEVSEAAGERQWTVTTNDEGESHALD